MAFADAMTMDTSSVFLVLRDLLIWGTVLHRLKIVAEIPIKNTT